MKLIRTAVPYSSVTRYEGPKDDPSHQFTDWETRAFQPPVPGALMLDRTWEPVYNAVMITWLVEGEGEWSPALALPPGP